MYLKFYSIKKVLVRPLASGLKDNYQVQCFLFSKIALSIYYLFLTIVLMLLRSFETIFIYFNREIHSN